MKRRLSVILTLALAIYSNAIAADDHGHDHDSPKKKSKAASATKDTHAHSDEHEDGEKKGDHKEEEKDEHGHAHDEEESGKDEHGEEEGHGDEHGHGHGEEEEEGGARVGPGKAITAASKKDGIKLSDKAIQTLGLRYQQIKSEGAHKLPAKAVVYFQGEMGVYRLRNGFFKLIEEIALTSKTSTEVTVKTAQIKSGDQVVIDGVPLLRAAELEAWGGSGDGHGH